MQIITDRRPQFHTDSVRCYTSNATRRDLKFFVWNIQTWPQIFLEF